VFDFWCRLQESNPPPTDYNQQFWFSTAHDSIAGLEARSITIADNHSFLQTLQVAVIRRYSGAYIPYIFRTNRVGRNLLETIDLVSAPYGTGTLFSP
jgi:hypothetical protein